MIVRAPSLFARMFALAAALMLISALAWVGIYSYFQREPRMSRLAQTVVTTVNLVRPAVLAAGPGTRAELLSDFAGSEGIRIYPAEANDRVRERPVDALTEKIGGRLGPHTRFAEAVNDEPGFWVSFEIDHGDEYWLMLPADRLRSGRQRAWLGWAAVAALLALAGAWGSVRWVTRPLSRLADAAGELGRGTHPAPLALEGPPEVASVARAFNQMSADLRALEAERSIALAGISHDLRTPLARLRLEIEMAGLPESTTADMIRDIEEMDEVVGQFVDYARSPDGEARATIDIVALLDSLARAANDEGAQVRVLARSPLAACVRERSVKRALLNLMQNARKYSQTDVRIELDASERGGSIEIDVIDNGPGIDPARAQDLKRAFVRGEAARSGQAGAGLGLAIVERIAKSHGGTLDLLPREGGGLIARLRLLP